MTKETAASQEPLRELTDAIASGDAAEVAEWIDRIPDEESARSVTRLRESEQLQLLNLLPATRAAELLEELPEAHAAELLERLDRKDAAAILNEVASDEQADLLNRLDTADAEGILSAMDPAEAAEARRLAQYPAESAGGLMISEYLSYPEDYTVDDVLEDLRANVDRYQRYDVQYAYVVDAAGRLQGVLRLRDLLLARPDQPVGTIAIRDPHFVSVDAPLSELERFFDRNQLFGAPVVDEMGMLVGVVRRQDVEQAAEERTGRVMLKLTGILGGEELRTMPLWRRSVRRLSWLSINIVLNLIAATVISAYQETLQAAITLAVFLPIISDMSGCSGSQAVAVSMRELALGLLRPTEVLWVIAKESAVGVINGLALGLLLGVIAFLWKGNPWLGGVVGVALGLNTLIAVCLGGSIPLILRMFKQDPALASGPILTTITDMCGFFLMLSLAGVVLNRLAT